jgi:hypothetical protein
MAEPKAYKELDEICKYLCFIRDRGVDQYTGEPVESNFAPHHFIHRGSKRLRWDLRDIFIVSSITHASFQFGKEPLFDATVTLKYPNRIRELLEISRDPTFRFRQSWFNELYENIRANFEAIFGSYDLFKKLCPDDKYSKALECMNFGGK